MENKRSIILNGNTTTHLMLVMLGLGILATTFYLTLHYFDTLYPTGLGGGSLCDLNSFFNCDAATHSKLSNLFGAPLGIFGLMIGVFLLSNYLFKSVFVEGSLYFTLLLNAVGCIALALYSLIALGSLCPFCTVYYLLSFLTLALFHFKSDYRLPSIKVLILFGMAQLIAGGGMHFYDQSKKKEQLVIADSLIKDFDSYANLGNPKVSSPHRITSATEKFEDAPLRLSIFSDFQCPACKALSESLGALAKKYKGQINIQYYFYPLDSSCNSKMTHAVHPVACEAAYLASCSGDRFSEVHDKIFNHQEDLNSGWLKSYAANLGVEDCFGNADTRKKVVELIETGNSFNVQSTPTLLLNGVKIEGVLPLNQLYILCDELLQRYARKQ
ncbi:MAG: thioredoxin domain-containing protein [Bdellovibrio sp.]|nr:thioredoxin domain-containing protein [Bdellovibrio sp.]